MLQNYENHLDFRIISHPHSIKRELRGVGLNYAMSKTTYTLHIKCYVVDYDFLLPQTARQ